jgi:hypothetical protein
LPSGSPNSLRIQGGRHRERSPFLLGRDRHAGVGDGGNQRRARRLDGVPRKDPAVDIGAGALGQGVAPDACAKLAIPIVNPIAILRVPVTLLSLMP